MSDHDEDVNLSEIPEANNSGLEPVDAPMVEPAAPPELKDPIPGVDHVPGLPGTPITTQAPQRQPAPVKRHPAAGQPADAFLPQPAAPAAAPVVRDYKYKEGDYVWADGQGGVYRVMILRGYPNLDAAIADYRGGSYRTILMGKASPDQPHYVGQIANASKKPVGLAQSNIREHKQRV